MIAILLSLAHLILAINGFLFAAGGVLLGASLFGSLLVFLRNKARKHGEVL